MIVRAFCLILLLGLGACGPKVITHDRPITISTPVPQPCALARPTHIPTLRERFPDETWAQMDTRQKAAAVGRQALERQAWGEQLEAATAACP